MFPSRYPGICSVCNEHFPAASLFCYKAAGAWRVVCLEHKDHVGRPAIKVTLEGPEVCIEAQNLSQAQFDKFLPLARSGRYDPARRVNLYPANGTIGEVLKALMAAELPVILDPGVKAMLEAEQANEQAALAGVSQDTRLFPFQRIGAAWLRSRTRALLADDMGLGKTAQALVAIEGAPPLVIVCPAVAKGVWAREIERWRPGNWRVRLLSGRGCFTWPGAGEAVIVNYDVLQDEPGQAHPWTALVFDEAHVLKEPRTNRHKRALRLVEQAGRVYLLTATPLLNRPQELWSLLKLAGLEREAYGTWGAFCYAFDGSPASGWGTPRPAAALGFSKVSLRRTKAEVLTELPPKRRAIIPVGATFTRTEQGVLDEADRAILLHGKSVPFELISKARAITATAKIGAMLDRVEEFEQAGEPLVVFSYHRGPIDTLAARPGWATITGDTSNEQRSVIEDKFQRGEYKGLAATIQAGGVAITLTHASHVLFCDRAWTPALNEQAEDRCNRIGQTKGVLVEVLVAEKTLDERVEEIIEEKSHIIANSVDKATVVRVDAGLFADLPEEVEAPPVFVPERREPVVAAAKVEQIQDLGAPSAWESACPF